MEIPDIEVYKTMKDVASMKTTVERVSKFIDNGVIDKRIQKAVENGVKACPFYVEGKVKKKVSSAIKWVLTLMIPVIVTVLTLFASGVFAKQEMNNYEIKTEIIPDNLFEVNKFFWRK